VIQFGNPLAKLLQTERFISVLTAFLPGNDDNTRREVVNAHCTFRLIDVLASRAARTKGIHFALSQQIFV